ncbi:MAG: ABC transporter permease [Atopobiaceae bacterium]|nr:ABC transporter permease [Atopobiaceae bacterium]
MKARDLLYETASALDANRGRSLLTILGIVIGIGAVIAMTALISGIKQSLVGDLGLDQARMVEMYLLLDRQTSFDDYNNLIDYMPEYETLTIMAYGSGKATSATKSVDVSVLGVLPNYPDVMGTKLTQGAFITPEDEEAGSLVVLLDQSAVRNLFGNQNESVVGKSVQVGDATYAIIGVVESSASREGGRIYMPYSTCAARITGTWSFDSMSGLAASDVDMSTIEKTTKSKLGAYFGIKEEDVEDSFYVYTMQSMLDELNATMAAFQILMTSVAGISLLVGGIGIMNMMLTNVTERIREIGLRKALGARSSDITKQFLLESVCLCISGGIIGIIFGYLGAYALAGLAGSSITQAISTGETKLVPVIDIRAVAFAAGICILIGAVFGYYPARQAAKLDPVESLHYQ